MSFHVCHPGDDPQLVAELAAWIRLVWWSRGGVLVGAHETVTVKQSL